MLKQPAKAERTELDVIVQEAADAVEMIVADGVGRGHDPLQRLSRADLGGPPSRPVAWRRDPPCARVGARWRAPPVTTRVP